MKRDPVKSGDEFAEQMNLSALAQLVENYRHEYEAQGNVYEQTAEEMVPCAHCGKHVPISECTVKTVEVESGRSGGSINVGAGLFSGNSKKLRKGVFSGYNFGRKFYRQEEQYVCKACQKAAKFNPGTIGRFLLWVFAVGGSVWVLEQFFGSPLSKMANNYVMLFALFAYWEIRKIGRTIKEINTPPGFLGKFVVWIAGLIPTCEIVTSWFATPTPSAVTGALFLFGAIWTFMIMAWGHPDNK